METINGQEVITNEKDGFRGFRPCKCVKCSVVANCVPHFDFYSTDETGDLLCEDCFKSHLYSNHFKS